ncbi:hypothetical protein LWI28_024234 [Acer negundo]|uniref:Uncharacterized protein n=1 Tax=Acer negundo TaxID=4023 RepID=A0AAD5J2C7_ACENE|nr:hypothetical protein LWI28_024234 [Acer negundo]
MSRPQFELHLPGSEILEFFSYWIEGRKITWPPPHCLLKDELIGCCVCAVISITDYVHIECRVENMNRSYFLSSHDYVSLWYPWYDFKGDDHLWLAYVSKNTLNHNDGEYDCGKGVTAWFEINVSSIHIIIEEAVDGSMEEGDYSEDSSVEESDYSEDGSGWVHQLQPHWPKFVSLGAFLVALFGWRCVLLVLLLFLFSCLASRSYAGFFIEDGLFA